MPDPQPPPQGGPQDQGPPQGGGDQGQQQGGGLQQLVQNLGQGLTMLAQGLQKAGAPNDIVEEAQEVLDAFGKLVDTLSGGGQDQQDQGGQQQPATMEQGASGAQPAGPQTR